MTALMTRRRQLMGMLMAEKNRLTAAPRSVHRDIKTHLTLLEKRLREMDDRLADTIARSHRIR